MIALYLVFIISYTFFSAKCMKRDILFNTDKKQQEELIEKYFDVLPLVLKNVYFYSLGFFGFAGLIYFPRSFNLLWSLVYIFISLYAGNILFYATHRYSHINKELFKYHKVHHEYKVPSGIRAAYTHPIDFIFGNMLPLGITPILLRADPTSLAIIIILANYNTIMVEHSNDKKMSNHHILHHKYSNCNYGAIWLDKICKTLKEEEEEN
jgi:sterol desaturase/sphingolipid hydroxylase (fatty acid hydroxylase superfamily)